MIRGRGEAHRIRRALSACAAVTLVLAACGGDDDDTATTDDAATTEASATTEATATTETSDTTAPSATTAASATSAPDATSPTTGPTTGASATTAAAPTELTKITLGLPRIVGGATIPLAIEQGFFADEGLEVEMNMTIANPAIAAAVISGDIQAGLSAWGAVTSFATQDVPVRVAVGLSRYGDGTGDTDTGLSVVSLADGSVQTAADLAGKTVVLNSLGTDVEATIRAVAINAGVDPDSINLQTVDLPEMGAALRAGRADAAVMSEPFLTQLRAEAEVVHLGSMAEIQPDRLGLNVIVSAQYAEEEPEIVAALQRALARAADYANDNPDAVRAILVDQYEFPQAVADVVPLPMFEPFPDAAAIQAVPQLLADVGIIEDVPDLAAWVLPPPEGLG